MKFHSSAQDLAAWGRLFAEAERMAARPTNDVEDLFRACKAANVAVVPAGTCDRTNPFFILLDLCRRVCGETMVSRAGSAPELTAAIEAADAVRKMERPELGAKAPPPEPPALPFRRDIDG